MDQGVAGSGLDPSEVGFEFGECHFDRVQVGRAGGQIQEPALLPFQQCGGFEAFVGGQVVQKFGGPANDPGDRWVSMYLPGPRPGGSRTDRPAEM